jgi:hypothetical protein
MEIAGVAPKDNFSAIRQGALLMPPPRRLPRTP